MAYDNGRIPADQLRPCDGTPGAVLLPVQAASWNAVRAEVHRRFGWYPTITSAGDAYRSLVRQVDLFQRHFTTNYAASAKTDRRTWNGQTWWRRPGYPSAATPGTSNHGKGVTVDVRGLGGFGTTRHRQFSEVAKKYGWSDDEGRRINEFWHWNGHNAIAPAGNQNSTAGSEIPDIAVEDIVDIAPKYNGEIMFIAHSIQDGTFWLVGPGFCHALTTMAQVTPFQAGGLKTVELDNGDISQIRAVSDAINSYTR